MGPRNTHPGGNSGDPYDTANAPSGKEKMNLGNKYAKSYSSKNPPPRAGEEKAGGGGGRGGAAADAAPTFMDDLGGAV